MQMRRGRNPKHGFLTTAARGLWRCALPLASAGMVAAAQYGATYTANPPTQTFAGSVVEIPIQITNTGTKTWVRDDCTAKTNFYVAYHWSIGGVSAGDNFDGERTPVPKNLPTGASAALNLVVRAPQTPGNYTLEIDLIEEGVTWFSLSPDKVQVGGPFNVTVQPAPANGALTGIRPWYPVATPTSLQKVQVLRQGNCPVTLDFGDGSPTVSLPANASGALHGYGVGTFTAKATGCGQTTTGTVAVASTACPLFITALIPTCSTMLCCDQQPKLCEALASLFPVDPKIESAAVWKGLVHPGDWITIKGDGFLAAGAKGKGTGKAELLLSDWAGNPVVFPIQVEDKSTTWNSEFILGRVPPGISGVMDQSGSIRVTRSDGKVSNLVAVSFVAQLDFRVLTPEEVQVTHCGHSVGANRCNNEIDADFSAAPIYAVQGFHQSLAVFCLLGGGTGADTYAVSLKNGWTVTGVAQHILGGDGEVTEFSGFVKGASDVTGIVTWSLDSCESITYAVNLGIGGPIGVPPL
jgi:hypothetical protein